MKLVLIKTVFLIFVVTVCSQKFPQDQFSYPPQIQKPTSSIFTSENSIYLPPESQTTIPYFTISDMNKIPIHFFPPTGTKAPGIYPTSLPIYVSSTLKLEDDDNEDDQDEIIRNRTPSRQIMENHLNRSPNNTTKKTSEARDSKAMGMTNKQVIPQTIEIKPLTHGTNRPKDIRYSSITQSPASRRMILTSEIQRNDQGFDQLKSSTFQNNPYAQSAGVFISSTTEPAIPIIRLSNEMDLDGSFSYEALGADQTHYVQHSRMENMGTDKEEQVVEGSYSYVGDDGRTYTVHYIADSNGFRATGDHLPVPPPVPEIIQRAVQYNLAEEAKKPPQLRSSWENDYKDYEINERNNYSVLPPRSSFTGKTPEAFSFGFSQGNQPQDNHPKNNLHSASIVQNPSKAYYENPTDPSKPLAISPQITFIASKGAHNPSISSQVPTKINNEKSSLPQLMNYEAVMKDSDQETNKALWRWQYGINSNTNQNPKNSISRSFSEGDDVVINFNDMTPDQYTHMIQTQVLSQNVEKSNKKELDTWNRSNHLSLPTQNLDFRRDDNESRTFNVERQSPEETDFYNQQINEKKKTEKQYDEFYRPSNINKENFQSEIISRNNFIPQSQVATQSYTFVDVSFEPSKIVIPNGSSDVNLQTVNKGLNNSNITSATNYFEDTITLEPLFNIRSNSNQPYFENNEEENISFKPITTSDQQEFKKETTTEASMEDMLRDNVFLRNLLKPSNNYLKVTSEPTVEYKKQKTDKFIETIQQKEPKYYQYKQIPENEVQIVKSKPLDVNNILNYVVMKNHFESVKTKPKNKPVPQTNQNLKAHYIQFKEPSNIEEEAIEDDKQKQLNDYKSLNHHQQQELQGLIKNYKVLQRHKNTIQRSQLQFEPQKHIKAFPTHNLPPLGRAGPSLKSYLPPTYL